MSNSYTTGSASIVALDANVEAGTLKLEQRKVSNDYPRLYWLNQTDGAPTAAGGDITLKGESLLGGAGTTLDYATLTEDAVVMTVHSLKPGVSGFSVEVLAGEDALAIAYASGKLTITLASGGSTADAIATAINADSALTEGIIRANVSGAGTYTEAIAETDFAGATGDYDGFSVLVSGVEALPANETGTTSTAKWSDTEISCTFPDLTGETDARAATDLVMLEVVCNNLPVFSGLIPLA